MRPDRTVPEPPGQSRPLSRAPFVGRQRELEQLQACFRAAAEGQGALAMLVGEPGIGKSALCEQLAEYTVSLGGMPLVGHCYEEGSRTLPYLPFVEALHIYVRSRDTAALRSELGDGASDVARLVTEIRDELQIELREPGDPEQDRWRLLRAVTEFLRTAALSKPLVLILEDLHDADRGTLDLLLYLARSLQGAHVLVVGTYRDVEVDRVHPLSAALAELRRATPLHRLLLRGLTVEDVEQLLRDLRIAHVGRASAEAIQRQTEGNPLFVQEVARYLLETRPVGGLAAILTNLPEGLRDVIGRRLSRLSPLTNQLLGAAAVIGREFRLDVLHQLVPRSEEESDSALEEAVAAGIIDERPTVGAAPTFRFAHALFRQALYDELIAPRRIRLHQHVARALEDAYGHRLEEHAAELAEHYAFSSDVAELARSVTYGEMAARQAMSVYAHGEAVRHLERALQVQQVLDSDDGLRRCDLLLALGQAMLPMEQARSLPETVAAEAFSLAETNADSGRAARAAILALEALLRTTGWPIMPAPDAHGWAERADRCAPSGTVERVYAECYVALDALGRGDVPGGAARLRTALEYAERLGDEAAFVTAAAMSVTWLLGLPDIELVDRLALALYARVRQGRLNNLTNSLLFGLGQVLVSRGDRDEAEQVWHELAQLATITRDSTVSTITGLARVIFASMDGRLEQAIALGESLTADESPSAANLVRWVVTRARFYLGRVAEIDPASYAAPSRSVRALKALALSYRERCDGALAIFAGFGNFGAPDDQSAVTILVSILEVSVRCGDTATAAAVVRRLHPLGHRVERSLVSLGRLVGEAEVMLGRPDEAQGSFRASIDVCKRIRLRPELALTRLDLAELLLAHYPTERVEGVELLRGAIADFREMKMQPSLDRALALAERAESAAASRVFHPAIPGGLTVRERDVAALLAAGLSNRELAEKLVITETTAEVHVKHILSKLGFRSRSQVAVWATNQGLTPTQLGDKLA